MHHQENRKKVNTLALIWILSRILGKQTQKFRERMQDGTFSRRRCNTPGAHPSRRRSHHHRQAGSDRRVYGYHLNGRRTAS